MSHESLTERERVDSEADSPARALGTWLAVRSLSKTGSAQGEWHAIISGWRLPEVSGNVHSQLSKAPERVARWSAVFNSVNAGLEVSRRALDLQGRRARLLDLCYLSGEALALMQRMELPRDWWFNSA